MKKMTRKSSIFLASVIVIAIVVSGVTLAYFHDRDQKKNAFVTAGIGLTIAEPGYNHADTKNMSIGDTITKDPTITNVKGDAYVRFVVKLVEKDSDTVITDPIRTDRILSMLYYDKKYTQGSGQVLDTALSYSETEVGALVGEYLKAPVNDEFTLDTQRSSTGIYYYNYNGILASGEQKVLFNHVVVPRDWSQADIQQMGEFDMLIRAEAIQSANINDSQAAFDALDRDTTP